MPIVTEILQDPVKAKEKVLEEEWNRKINRQLQKYPFVPGKKLIEKLSQQCWNEVYQQYEQVRTD
jgi:hypothetical protein